MHGLAMMALVTYIYIYIYTYVAPQARPRSSTRTGTSCATPPPTPTSHGCDYTAWVNASRVRRVTRNTRGLRREG
eukprot:scaffold105720_cov54-Phaeocystis_antarctica.AAC.1